MTMRARYIAASVVLIAGHAHAQQATPPPNTPPVPVAPPPADVVDISGQGITVTLTSGEVMKGVVKAVDTEAIVIRHPVLGDVRIPRTGIASSEPSINLLQAPPPLKPAPQAPAEQPKPEPAKPEPAKPEPAKPEPAKPGPSAPPSEPPKPKEFVAPTSPWEALTADDEKPFLDGWKRNFEIGLNGTTGPIDSQSYRAILTLNRGTKLQTTNATFQYAYAESTNGKTQDRGEFSGRNEWRFAKPQWSMWVGTRNEVDNLNRWDARLSVAAGLGYQLYQNESKSLTITGRLGAGLAREINGDNAFLPEVGIGVFSLDYKLNDKTSMYLNSEFYPSGKRVDLDEFRAVSRAGINWKLDKETNMNLRLGVEHRHESNAPGGRNNVLDYFLVLGFAF